MGYNKSIESDILLLDISNDEEYIWTYDFNVSTLLTPSPGLAPSTTQIDNIKSPNNKPTIIVATIGSLLGVVLLISGGVFLRKWKDAYENNKIQMNPVAIDHF